MEQYADVVDIGLFQATEHKFVIKFVHNICIKIWIQDLVHWPFAGYSSGKAS